MEIKELIELLTNLATVLGIPSGLFLYFTNIKKEKQKYEYDAYISLDDKFASFQQLCIQYPQLNLHDISLENTNELSQEQKIQQAALFDILVSIFERAHFMYKSKVGKNSSQWIGWNAFMNQYAQNKIFVELWKSRNSQFSGTFVNHINNLIKENEL